MSRRSSEEYAKQAQIFALAQVVSDGGNSAPIFARAWVRNWKKEHCDAQSCFFILNSEDMITAMREHSELFDPCGRYGTLAWKGESNFYAHYQALCNYPSFDCLPFVETIKSLPKNVQGTRATALELKAIELLRIVKGWIFSHDGLILRGKNGKYHQDGTLQHIAQFFVDNSIYLAQDGKMLLEVKGLRGAFTSRGIMALEAENDNDND